jgi:hypothetical protein
MELTHRLERDRIENFHRTGAPGSQNELTGSLWSKL